MARIDRFEDLRVWQKARELDRFYIEISKNTSLKTEFELKNQMTRSSVSIMSNIAEGFGRGSNKEFINFLIIAKGSANELRSQFYNAFDRSCLNKEEFDKAISLANEVAAYITNFITYLKGESDRTIRK